MGGGRKIIMKKEWRNEEKNVKFLLKSLAVMGKEAVVLWVDWMVRTRENLYKVQSFPCICVCHEGDS